jgi:hypothetical protein
MHKFEFCIPTPGKAVPAGAAWFHEVKYDGYRLRIERDGNSVRLITRGGHDWTKRFPWHGKLLARTDNSGSPRMHRPIHQINGFTAPLSRKLLTFFFALAVTVLGVCSPASSTDSCSRAFGRQGGTGCNSVVATGGGVAVQWNVSDKSTGITLSGTPLLTANDTNGSGNDTVRADTSAASGGGKKWYFEVVNNAVAGGNNCLVLLIRHSA